MCGGRPKAEGRKQGCRSAPTLLYCKLLGGFDVARARARFRVIPPLDKADRVPHLLLDTGGADAADAQSSPKGANYLSPGQRPGSENPDAPCRKP